MTLPVTLLVDFRVSEKKRRRLSRDKAKAAFLDNISASLGLWLEPESHVVMHPEPDSGWVNLDIYHPRVFNDRLVYEIIESHFGAVHWYQRRFIDRGGQASV